jgi:hypothetical protein
VAAPVSPSPAPIDHAAVRRALSSLTATLGDIAVRIECRAHEEHRSEDASPVQPIGDERDRRQVARR